MKYIFLTLLFVGCSNHNECFEKGRPWDYFDYCAEVSGTPQYEMSHPAPCPWPEKNDECVPPK